MLKVLFAELLLVTLYISISNNYYLIVKQQFTKLLHYKCNYFKRLMYLFLIIVKYLSSVFKILDRKKIYYF